MADSTYDVIVVGGGPAGSTVGTLVAREARRVLLLDREPFPRFRVGESLMPASYWTLERLGVLERMRGSVFPRKHSVQFFASNGKSSQPFYFSEIDPHESSVTWQVDRAEFDQMLLNNARDAGVEVRLQANVREVLFDGARARGVVAELPDGARREIEAAVVVDASGQSAMLSRKLSLKHEDPLLRHVAYYTRYRGALRDEGIDEGATLILQTTEAKTWFWYIPLPDDQVSVGVVGPLATLRGAKRSDPETVFREALEKCSALQPRIRDAQRVFDVRAVRDFSYISRSIAGEGWVLAGDAFGFLDPIYSTGVFLALKSAEFAADAINGAFERNDFSAAQLGRNGQRYLEGMEALRKLVYAYYDSSFSVARFLRENPRYRDSVVNLLTGNVFRVPVHSLFDAMGRELALPESRRLIPVTE